LTNEDIVKFQMQMRRRGLSPRTIHNRHMSLRAFLLTLGFGIKEMKEIAGKAPRFDKTLPEIYEPGALKSFFESLDTDYDKLLFDLLLTTGLREREAMHLEFVDISHARRVLHVRSKPDYGHRIKDAEEREMPLTAKLVKRLRDYQERHPDSRLVFGKRGGLEDAPDGHLLRRLKVLVRNAGLNCGTCTTCLSSQECEHWFLHKFRATYITMLLRNGLDLRSVMALSGHADLASVMRYLRPAGTAEVQDKVNSIVWH
jgi:integrase